MLFNSFSFLIFFPVVVIVYYLLPQNRRVLWLLLASCYFYMSFVPAYIIILLSLITLDYFLAQLIEHSTTHRRAALWLSIAANLGVLFFFKYFNFFNVNVSQVAQLLHWNYSYTLLSIALPLGLSFHVFQSLSYVIEVYRGKFIPERNYLIYALYVMFFPQLLAGPIERPQHLLPQFRMDHSWDEIRVRRGLERMAWGFFKKMVIADNISLIVAHVYTTMPDDGPTLLLTSVLFAYQLYCDFSGYSDIAVGTALVLGYDIMENFNRPYASASIAEFWRRWHISLSSWFRDYLFTPLALNLGRRSPYVGVYISIFITFVLMGLWHGANWTYIVMGALFGFYIIFGMVTKRLRDSFTTFIGLKRFPRVHHMLQVLITFVLTSIAWVFFRAESVSQAVAIIGHLGVGLPEILNLQYLHNYILSYGTLGASRPTLLIIGYAIVMLEYGQYLQQQMGTQDFLQGMGKLLRIAWLYAIVASIICFGYFGAAPFIYFQF